MVMLAIAIITFVIYYQKRILQEKVKQQAIEVDYQQKMIQATLNSQENERKRLAADLHDSIGAMLSAIKLGLSSVAKKEGISAEAILPTKEMLDETINSVRSISRDLMPSTLEKFGLSMAVEEICQRYGSTSGIAIRFSENGTPLEINPDYRIMIFRIIQELINNSLKHAQATTIYAHLEWEDTLTFFVADNGKGFDRSTTKEGLGLFTIENRAHLIGGTVAYESSTGGSKISVSITKQS